MAVNRVVAGLSLLAIGLFWTLHFGSVQPNRIVPGTAVGAWEGLGAKASLATTAVLLVLLGMALLNFRGRHGWLSGVLTGALAAVPLLLHVFITRHLDHTNAYARIGVGPGVWALLFLLGLMLSETLRQLPRARIGRLLAVAGILCGWAYGASQYDLHALSLVQEYRVRPEQFVTALRHHLMLSLGAVLISLVVAIGLALLVMRRSSWQRPVFGVVSFLQTIPSLALFGLLIAPLSLLSSTFPWLQELGIRGIGWAPAMIALVAYSLLPMLRNTFVALTSVADELLEAGAGMGMSPRQMLLQVRLPLAMPVIIEGVRVTTIQAIGLTAVAALVGAGGFGTFIFQGLGQAAMDLVLLGALPTIVLALFADALFTVMGKLLSPAGDVGVAGMSQ
ncbi:ABC transporter permease [Marinobacter sp. X15-166B]|nr:ABC transporter permease [Marinobacter sp. X15-166B]